jgi:hypothetical protein
LTVVLDFVGMSAYSQRTDQQDPSENGSRCEVGAPHW